ncbi:ABC transporter permease [Chloroflexi bacterium TSY]|nr:ABC transporter permease [Chloroflexi bacterium TSY]
MAPYIWRRLLLAVPVFFGITFSVYLAINLAPGDPINSMIPFEQIAESTPEEIEAIRRSMGLDQPLLVRYAKWLGQLAQGNLGRSFKKKAPVLDLLKDRVVNTLKLSSAALLIALGIGVTSGIVMALKQYSWLDYTLSVFTLAQWSTPPFFVALAAIYLFSVQLNWLPAFGMVSAREPASALASLWDQLRHLIMPATILGLYGSATYARYTRASVLDILNSDYVTTAHAKGLRERIVIWRHVFRNAALPIVTIVGLSLGNLLGGAVIVETIFAWPGMGKLGVAATIERDYPLLMGVVVVGAIMVLLSNLIADIVYAWVDPRIHYD